MQGTGFPPDIGGKKNFRLEMEVKNVHENQKILEMLSDAEMNAFYAFTHCADAELKEMLKENHASAKKTLEAFASATGCRL